MGYPNIDWIRAGRKPGGSDDFQGRMDDIRVYNRGLEPWEIKKIYEEGYKKYFHCNRLRVDGSIAAATLSTAGSIAVGEDIYPTNAAGMKIATAINQLLGFYGTTPVNQPDTISDPTGGGVVDAEARTAINTIINRLQELGLIA